MPWPITASCEYNKNELDSFSHECRPRSGKDITMSQLIHGLQAGLNFSYGLSLVLAIVAVFHCGSIWNRTISLDKIALHNELEHDASLFHDDAAKGAKLAPAVPNPALFEDLASLSTDRKTITSEDLIKHKLHREASSPPLGMRLHAGSMSEVSVIVEIIGDGRNISLEKLHQFVFENRLPEGSRKEIPFSFSVLLASMSKLKDTYKAVAKANQPPPAVPSK
jgi:hypothetical protein